MTAAGRRRPLAHPGRRLRAGFAVLVVLLVLFAGRLLQLQGLDSASYARIAVDQRRHVRALPADRGAILDRHGVPLAMSVDTKTIFADPKLVGPRALDVSERLAPMLGMPEADVIDRLIRPGRYVVIKRDVPPSLARAVLDVRLDDGSALPGIGAEPAAERVYPAARLAANLLGIMPNDQKDSGAGLELSANRRLAGRAGEIVAETGAGGLEIPVGGRAGRAAVAGETLQLSIDRDIQWAAQRAVTAQVRSVRADSGTAIVMDPRTGEVLAMATAPTFDANNPGRKPPGVSLNSAVSDVYEPGSVNKVITVAGALQDAAVTPGTPITVPPTLKLVGHVFHDAETHGTEHLTVSGVLAKSSNIGTIRIAQRLGRDRLDHYLRAFGFGAQTGVGLPGESRGILPPSATWSASQQYTVPFGQGVSVTALQVASVYATLANGGIRTTPTLVRATIDAEGKWTAAPAPERRRVVSSAVAHHLRDMLEAATSREGTAPKAHVAGYRVAGKTGTAQRPNPRCGCYRGGGYTASFVGFAPADRPQLLVEVVLQNPRRGHYGGVVAAPVFHEVMAFALKTLAIPPTGTKRPTIRLEAPTRPASRKPQPR